MKYSVTITYDIVSPHKNQTDVQLVKSGFTSIEHAHNWAINKSQINSYEKNHTYIINEIGEEDAPSLDEYGHIVRTIDKYMMGTVALHQMGDISSEVFDICSIYAEDNNNYYGSWVFGFGFFDVCFPKSTTRELTNEEIERYKKTNMCLSGVSMGAVIK